MILTLSYLGELFCGNWAMEAEPTGCEINCHQFLIM